MLTTEQLDDMTPEARTQLFEALAVKMFGPKSYSDATAKHFGVSRPSVFSWRRKHNVPYAVLMALDMATVGPKPIEDMTAAIAHLVGLQAETARAIEQLFKAFEAFAAR